MCWKTLSSEQPRSHLHEIGNAHLEQTDMGASLEKEAVGNILGFSLDTPATPLNHMCAWDLRKGWSVHTGEDMGMLG